MPDIFDQVASAPTPTARGRHVGDIFDQISSASDSIGLGDVLKAGGEGLMSLVGGLAPAFNADPTGFAGQQAVDAGRRVANYYATSPGNVAPRRAAISAIPVIGPAAADIAAPTLAVASGRPPTRAENLDAIRSGTATAAGLAAPVIAGREGAARAATTTAAADTAPATAMDAAPALDPAALTRLQRSLPGAGIDPATGANAARALAQYQKISGGAIKSLSDVPDAVSTALDQATGWKARNPDVADPALDQYITDLEHAQKSIVPIVRQQLAPKPGFAEHPIQRTVDIGADLATMGAKHVIGKALVNKLVPEAPQVIDNFTAPFGKRLNAAAANVPVTDRLTSLGQPTPDLPEIAGGGPAIDPRITALQQWLSKISPEPETPSSLPVSSSNVGGADIESLSGTPLAHEDGLQALPDLTDYVEPGAKQIPIPRRINRKTTQLEIGGETVGKRVPYEQQLPDPTSTMEAARAKSEQQLQRRIATTAIARDTMQSDSFRQWSSNDQREFGRALSQGDPGTAAAIASRAEQQAAGVDNPAFGGINHLSDAALPDAYNSNIQLDHIDPSGHVTPLTDLPEFAAGKPMYTGKGLFIRPDGKITQANPDVEYATTATSKPLLESASKRPDAEWPKSGNVNENDPILSKTLPSKLLPARFKNARSVSWGSPLKKALPDDPTAHGIFGVGFPSGKMGSTYANNILISGNDPTHTDIYTHELGHSAYIEDLTQQERNQWKAIYDNEWSKLRSEAKAALAANPTADKNAVAMQAARKHPTAIVNYHGTTKYDESFAEMFGQYMANPTAFKQTYPNIYGYFKNLFGGVEYISKKGAR